MIQLVYLSTANVLFSPQEIAQILATSRRNNVKDDITGLLMYHDGCFFQVLEGESDAVKKAFARITDDPRHFQCIKLVETQIAARSFPDWGMGYASPEDLGPSGADSVVELQSVYDNADVLLGSNTKLSKLVKRFISSFREVRLT